MRKIMLLLTSVLLTLVTSIAFSALSTSLAITSEVRFRFIADIRINSVSFVSASNGAQIGYESDFSKNTVSNGFILPNSGSSISYKVHVDNSGDVDYSIYNILRQSSDNGVNVVVSGYNVQDVIPAKTSVDLVLTYTTTNPSESVINVVETFDYRKVYHVTYETGTSVIIPAQVKYEGVNLTLTSQEPTRSGYTFTKWNTESDGTGTNYNAGSTYVLDEDVTLYAQYVLNNYNITYALNNGTVATANPTTYSYTDPAITLNNPTKTLIFKGNPNATSGANAASGTVTIGANTTANQTFAGWSGTGITGNSTNVTIPTGSTGDRSYTAHWTAVAPAKLPKVEKTGYTCGWSTTSTGKTIEYESEATNYPTSAITESQAATVNLYAVCNPNTYELTINPNGGTYDGKTTNSTKTMTYDSNNNNDIGVPTRSGYTFDGWYIEANTKTNKLFDNTGKNTALSGYFSAAYSTGVWKRDGVATVYAHWSKAVSATTNSVSPTSYIYDATAKSPTPTVKDGSTTLTSGTDYTISYTNNTNVGTATATITGKNVYNATTKAYYTGTATVNFAINNAKLTFDKGSCDTTSGTTTLYTKKGATGVYTGVQNTTAGTIPTASKTGYKFDGWYTASTGGSKVLNANRSFTGTAVTGYVTTNAWDVTADKTLYAQCSPNTYTVTANANGGTIASTTGWSGTGNTATKSVTYDSAYGTLPTISKTGYTSNGWYANLVKAVDFQDNAAIQSNTGAYAPGNTNYFTTPNLIPIKGGATLYSNIQICGIYTYDSTGTFIRRESSYTTTHPISANAAYIRIEVRKSDGDFNYYMNNLVISEYPQAGNISGISSQLSASTVEKIPQDHSIYAKWQINDVSTPTISGGATKIYGASATTLTCTENTSYASGVNKYYSFGYATSDGGTPDNWTTPSTSSTLNISATEYVGQRWYSCRVYASDGAQTTSTKTSAAASDTEMTINNAKITWDANSCGTISGTNPAYVRKSQTGVFTGIRNSTAGTMASVSKTGYTFNGWYDGTTKVINADGTIVSSVSNWTDSSKKWLITADKTLKASCTRVSYTITYALNNGTNNSNNPSTYTIESSAITLAAPTKTLTFKGNPNATSGANAASGTVTIGANTTANQTFAGWSGTGITGNSTNVTIPTGSTGDRSYTAHWTAVAPAKLPKVEKTGYTCGWSTTSTGKTIEYESEATNYPTSAITESQAATVNLYAVCNPNTYELTINPNGGTYDGKTTNSTKTMTYDSNNNNDIGVPTRSGYTFDGWYLAANSKTSQLFDNTGKNTNLSGYFSAAYSTGVWKKDGVATVYAHWSKAVNTTTNSVSPTSYIYDGTAKTPTPTVKDGSTTLTNNTDYSVAYTNNTNVGTATATITGKNVYNATTKAYYTGTATVNFAINNAKLTFDKGSCDTTSGTTTLYTKKGATGVYTGVQNTTAGTIPTASKTGYKFDGWYTASTGGSKVLNANRSFTGTAVTGYVTTNAWDVTADKTLYAQCSPATYTVSYNGNGNTGGSTANSTHTYDVEKALTTNGFTKTGYTFTGWSTSASDKNLAYDNAEYVKDNTSGSSYVDIKSYTVAAPFAAGEVYQLDFEAKGTGNLTTYFYGGSNYLRVASVTNSDGYSGAGTDGYNAVALTSSYKHYSVRFTLGSTGDGSVNKIALFRVFSGNSATIKNIRFVKVSSSSTAYVDGQVVKNLTATNGATVNLYALWTINNPATPTISGGATKVYGSSATTLTCSTATNYASGTSKYYSFGYATSDGGTPGNWTTASTTATLNIAADAYVGQRWYSCRVYASDGSQTTSTVASAVASDTEMTINNAKITYDANSCGTISGTSPAYVKKGTTGVYTGIRNTTAGTMASVSKAGWTFNGWYDGTTKVINGDGTIVASVSNWTDSSKKWLITADKTLKASCTINGYTVTYNTTENGGTGTIASQTIAYGSSIPLPTTGASKAGWTFVGWNTDKNATTALSSLTMGTDDVILYAIYRKEAVTLTADWHANGATLSSTAQSTCTLAAVYNNATQATSCTVTAPTITRTNYDIVGWNQSATATTNDSNYNTSTGKLTLTSSNTGKTWYAITKAQVALTATFANNNGATVASTTATCYLYGASESCQVTAPTVTAQTGFNHIGFNMNQNATSNSSSYNTTTNKLTITGNSTWYPITKSASQYTGTFNIQDSNAATKSGGTLSCYRYNGATNCNIIAPKLTAKSGYTVVGWDKTATSTTAAYASEANISINANTTFYSITYYNTTVTITFNRNTTNAKVVSQTPKGGTASTDATVTASCTKMNGATSCSITSPTMTVLTGYHAVGYATSASATSSSWNQDTAKTVSTNATYYAITAGNSYTIKFNANCPTGTTATGTMDNLAMVYGTAKNLTKNAFGCSGRAFVGWALNTAGTGDSYDDQESVSNLTTTNGATVNLYAKWRLAPPSPTISGGATKIYGTTATTLTCSESTTYPSGITKYYSFGYATSANGTPSGWTEASTTNTLSIGSTAFIASRYYSCRVYVSNGSEVSDTVVSSNTTNMAIHNAKLTFNAANCGTISGTSPGYVNNSMTGIYTGVTNTTAGTIPTVSKSGWTFNGWYAPTTATGLPSGYTRVDYIESTGTQYIDTGYKATPTTGVEIDYQFSTVTPYQQRLFGANTSNDSYLNYHMYINGVGNWAYAFKDGAGNWVNTGVAANTNRHTIKFNTTSGKVIVDSTTLDISSSTRTKTTETNMYIMLGVGGGENAKMKLYSFKMYANNSTTLTRDMVPCIKDSTGEAGMYDLVGNTFYGNSGTGEFIVGNSTKVISSDRTIQPGVSGWTDSNSKWLITEDRELVARCTPNYTVKFVGTGIISTPYDGNYVTIPRSTNSYGMNNKSVSGLLSVNTKYALQYKYKSAGQSSDTANKFDIDLFPDTLPQTMPVATGSLQDGVWYFSTTVSDITTASLRIFDDQKGSDNYYGGVELSDIILSVPTEQSKPYEGTYGSMPTATRAGYSFNGWYTAPSGGTQVTSSTKISAPGDHTLYAHWTPNNYVLTVAPNGGNFNGSTSNTTYTQAYSTLKVLPMPTRTGYTFNGWSQSGSGTLTKYGTPKFSEPYSSMGLYNNSQNGTVTHTSVARSSDSPILTSANMLQIRTAGTASPGLGGFYQSTQSRANAVFYHVIVAKIPVGYTIKYAQNATGDGRVITWLTPQAGTGKFEVYIYRHTCGSSGTFSDFGHVYIDGPAATSSNPVTWYVAYANMFDYSAGVPNASSQVFSYGAGNTTLTANWTQNIYAITLNQQSGSGGTGTIYEKYGSGYYTNSAATTQMTTSANGITVPSRTGYTFGGYYTSTGGGGTQYIDANGKLTSSASSTHFTAAGSLYAKWTPISYSISYNLNSGSVSGNPTSYNIETAAFTLKNPSRTGYTFTGWSGTGLSGSANTSVTVAKGSTGNRSYTANWSANSYYLNVNGLLAGASKGSTEQCGTFDVYTNGTLRANDVNDYNTAWVTGTTYSISDIKAKNGCTYAGVSSGSASGTITGSNVTVQLKYTFAAKNYGYTGGVQSFVAPISGTYKLQVWGAQGGTIGTRTGGLGGYAYGNKALTAGNTIYVVVGQQPPSSTAAGPAAYGGYNGGGNGNGDVQSSIVIGDYARGGGGATHIGGANTNTQLKSVGSSYRNGTYVYIVAGGGGGGGEINNGGAGGAATGGTGGGAYGGTGGSQSAGGQDRGDKCAKSKGSFGQGGSACDLQALDITRYWAGGGGGGWYGGGGGDWSTSNSSSSYSGGGGGGSNYVGGVTSSSTQQGKRSGSGYATISFVS